MSLNLVHSRLDRSRLILERKLLIPMTLYLRNLSGTVIYTLTQELKKAKYKDPIDWGAIENFGIKYIKPTIMDAYATGGNSAYGIVGLTGSFDVYNVEAVEAVETLCSKLIRNITSETKKAINRRISAGIEEGLGYYDIMRDIRSFVGLTDLQAKKVEEYKAWLGREYPDATASEVSRKAAELRTKLLNQRLSTIARTETARAQNYGFVSAMSSFGVDQFEFSVYPGACEEFCVPLGGHIYDLGEADEIIPVHPNCRCVLLPVIRNRAVETPLKRFPNSLEEPI